MSKKQESNDSDVQSPSDHDSSSRVKRKKSKSKKKSPSNDNSDHSPDHHSKSTDAQHQRRVSEPLLHHQGIAAGLLGDIRNIRSTHQPLMFDADKLRRSSTDVTHGVGVDDPESRLSPSSPRQSNVTWENELKSLKSACQDLLEASNMKRLLGPSVQLLWKSDSGFTVHAVGIADSLSKRLSSRSHSADRPYFHLLADYLYLIYIDGLNQNNKQIICDLTLLLCRDKSILDPLKKQSLIQPDIISISVSMLLLLPDLNHLGEVLFSLKTTCSIFEVSLDDGWEAGPLGIQIRIGDKARSLETWLGKKKHQSLNGALRLARDNSNDSSMLESCIVEAIEIHQVVWSLINGFAQRFKGLLESKRPELQSNQEVQDILKDISDKSLNAVADFERTKTAIENRAPYTDPRHFVSSLRSIIALIDERLITLLEDQLIEPRDQVILSRRHRLYTELRDSQAEALLRRALANAADQAAQQTHNDEFVVDNSLKTRLADLHEMNPSVDVDQLTPRSRTVTLDHAPWQVAVSHAQGLRDEMQDAHLCTEIRLPIDGEAHVLSLVALFDGHGEHGAEVARHCADNLPVLLKNALIEFCAEKKSLTHGRLLSALTRAFVRLDDDTPVEKGGATATLAMLCDDHLWVANVGDSRAVLCGTDYLQMIAAMDGNTSTNNENRNDDDEDDFDKQKFQSFSSISTSATDEEEMVRPKGVGDHVPVMQLTEDAKPTATRYLKSIEKRGGYVLDDRVNGALAVARSIGDKHIGPAVSPRPKVTLLPLRHVPNGAHLVLACDGLFDVASSQQVAEAVVYVASKATQNEVADIAEALVAASLVAGSTDNVSTVVVRFANEKSFREPAESDLFQRYNSTTSLSRANVK